MTDKQFNSFVRFLLDSLLDAIKAKTEEERQERLQKIVDNLQKTLED